MRRFVPLFPLILAFAQFNCQKPTPPRKGLIQDLLLEIQLLSPSVVSKAEQIELTLVLHNQSPHTAHPVVMPGDGSDFGWREPHVYLTGTIDTGDGIWKPLAYSRIGRCGLFDADWQKDVAMLGPGERIFVDSGIIGPSPIFEIRETGRIRLVAHYTYRKGGGTRIPIADAATSPMAGISAFEIVSPPVEIEVTSVESPPSQAG